MQGRIMVLGSALPVIAIYLFTTFGRTDGQSGDCMLPPWQLS